MKKNLLNTQESIMHSTDFVKNIIEENAALFKASKLNVKKYFEEQPDQSHLVDHFIGRMVNEHMNFLEITATLEKGVEDATERKLLLKQAMDEARHTMLVREVIEHIKGEKIDFDEAVRREQELNTAKGATLLEKYGAQEDEAALAAYQLVAEGRAEAVWDQMADTIEDEFISTRYRKIARDEGFHSKIGAMKLAKLATTESKQSQIMSIVNRMRKDLFDISCANTTEAPGARELVKEAYGW